MFRVKDADRRDSSVSECTTLVKEAKYMGYTQGSSTTDNLYKILAEKLPPETFVEFQSWHKKYKKAPQYKNNEFGFLKSIRRFFMRKFESTHEISFLETGLAIFEALFEQNSVDKSYILIHKAYFHEYLQQSEKADKCIKMALHLSTDTSLIVEKIGNFYCHLAEKQFSNPVERASCLFTTLADTDSGYKGIIEQQIRKIETTQFYGRFKTLTGNNADQLASQILSDRELLSRLKDMLFEMKSLVEASQLTVDAGFLDRVVRSAFKKAGNVFRNRKEFEFSNECTLLDIICSTLFIASKGQDDPTNFTNFCDIADILYSAKKQDLHLLDDAKEYYEHYEIYIEKAIELGEKAIVDIEPQNKNAPKFYSSLANVYRLRGNLNIDRNQWLAFKDFRRAIELFRALGNKIYEESYLDWDVDRLAECYFHLGEYENAIQEYKILKEKSKSKKYQATLSLGDVYEAMGDFQNAKSCFLECRAISKDDPASYDKLSHLHRNYGYYDDAIKWRHQVISLESIQLSKKDLDYQYSRLAILYEEKGNNEKAIDTFRYIVTERQPDSLMALDHLITLLISVGNYQEAIKRLEQKIKIPINKPVWDYCRLGDCFLYLNNDSEALKYYNKALALDSESIPALHKLAKWHDLKKQYREAIRIVKKIIEIVGNKQSDGFYKWIGDLQLNLGEINFAIDAYDESLKIKPGQREIYDRIKKITGHSAPTQFFVEKISGLESLFKTSLSPEIATRIVNYSIYLKDKKEYVEKIRTYLPYTIYTPNEFAFLDKLALIYEAEGRYQQAVEERLGIDNLRNIELHLRVRNLRNLVELVRNRRLYQYRHLESDCIKKIENIIEKATTIPYDSPEIEIDEETIDENIYIFREDIQFLAKDCLAYGYYEKARKYIRKLLESSRYELRNDKVYLQTGADIFFAEGKLEDAKKVAYKIIKIEGKDSHALFLLGRICRRKKEYSEAIDYFQRSYNASDGRIDALDQIGVTYREWAKEPTLSEHEKKGIKRNAIEWYKNLLKQRPADTRLLYGLAKSYLLEPLSYNDIHSAKENLMDVLRSKINFKSYITQTDIDNKAIAELLYLWAKHKELTIKNILVGKYIPFGFLYPPGDAFFKQTIINTASSEVIFEDDIKNTLQEVFTKNHDVGVRKAICRYSMKYLIYKCYQSVDIQELQGVIKEIVELILNNSKNQDETLRYLAEFLGSERGAYLEFLEERVYQEIKNIQDSVWSLSEDNPERVVEISNQIQSGIKSLKEKLDAIKPFLFAEKSVNIKEELERKKGYYHGRAGENMDLRIDMWGVDDIYISQFAWQNVDNFVFNTLDIIKTSGLNGSFALIAGCDGKTVFLLAIGKFPDLQGDWQSIAPSILDAFTKLSAKDLKTALSQLSDGFIALIVFEEKGEKREIVPDHLKNLLNFLVTTYALPLNPDYWREVYSLTKREVSPMLPAIRDKIINHTLFQLSTLFSKTKDLLNLFLNEPHDLKKLCSSEITLSQEERRTKILKVKNAFRNLTFFTRDFLCPDSEPTEFYLEKVISSIIKEFASIRASRDFRVDISFKTEKDDIFPFIGYLEDVELVIRNLFFNAYDAINKKLDSLPEDYKPEIQISLYREDEKYKVLFSDNGTGIPDGTKVTDLLKNLSKSGTGVGLNIILTLVNRYKGYFEVFSSKTGEDSGATFMIKLPIPNGGNRDEKAYQ